MVSELRDRTTNKRTKHTKAQPDAVQRVGLSSSMKQEEGGYRAEVSVISGCVTR